MKALAAAIAVCCALAHGLQADVAAEQEARYRRLPAGTEVSAPRALEGMALALGKTNPNGFAEQVPVTEGPGFEKAIRIVTRRVPGKPAALQTSARCAAPVKKNDLMLAVFFARAAGASEEAEGAFVFEHGTEAAARSAHYRFECGREWRRFFVPFLATRDYAAGDALIRFHAGYGPQVLEIGGLRVVSYGTAVAFGDLPYTPLSYQGRAENAPWRTDAAAAIEKNRKAQFTIMVRNAKGKLLPWTEVRVRQREHAYGFGTTVTAAELLGESDDGERYRGTLLQAFNRASLDADFDWAHFTAKPEPAADAVQWLHDNELGARSDGLLWPGGDLPAGLGAPEELPQRVAGHVRDKLAMIRGLISEWSAPAAGGLSPASLAGVFKIARETDPQARLAVHLGNLLGGSLSADEQRAAEKIIRALLETKAPLQSLVLGARFDEQLLSPSHLWETLEHFAAFDLPMEIADLEINAWDELAQADYLRDFLTVAFAHPATTGVTLSGFWTKTHPAPNAALYQAGWAERPAARAWRELVFKKWWTTTTTTTNAKGVAKVKGFLGDYAIEVRSGGQTKTVHAKLGKGGTSVTVEL